VFLSSEIPWISSALSLEVSFPFDVTITHGTILPLFVILIPYFLLPIAATQNYPFNCGLLKHFYFRHFKVLCRHMSTINTLQNQYGAYQHCMLLTQMLSHDCWTVQLLNMIHN